ncbi:MAG: hypothetical protein M1835_004482 [Candelina submexicana]|nr:MAG: hypothetical protein M1835_004482 [Candelina submexicana]
MQLLELLCPTLLALSAYVGQTDAARKPSDSVQLSNVKTLTLRKDLKTTHRRVSAVPQLKCVGGNGKGHYEVDVMRCKNQGSDYEDENVQWTCTASLPDEFKLGSTDVICEGYDSSEDPYVLKGSCGVEYRLMLTDLGEHKYGRGSGDLWRDFRSRRYVNWPAIIFWGIFIAVVGWMAYNAFIRDQVRRPNGGRNPLGWGGGGADDPPPPYDWSPPRKPQSSTRGPPAAGTQGWRPGFMTGALSGAAAGYLAGNRGRNQQQPNRTYSNQQGGSFWGDNAGEGSSGWGGGGGAGRRSNSSGSSFSSTRHESSGFGSTSRR